MGNYNHIKYPTIIGNFLQYFKIYFLKEEKL